MRLALLAALAACGSSSSAPVTPAATTPDAAPAPPIDARPRPIDADPEEGLRDAPDGEFVFDLGGCRWAGVLVRCPAGGPTGVLPSPTHDGDVYLDPVTLQCFEPGEGVSDGSCWKTYPVFIDDEMYYLPSCVADDDVVVPCPDELLPLLAAGVEPTRAQLGRCWYGRVEVACPKKK